MNNYHRGKWAEYLACCFLRLHGYQILERNYITGKGTTAGEIDCIARCGKDIIFIEIKERRNLDIAAYAITNQQKKRIIRGAESWLKKHRQYQNYNFRFDALLFAPPLHIRHIRNAWSLDI